jgi:tRNA modification GTPase
MNDTIAAIATPSGEGGIAVIRVSGGKAFQIIDTCFKAISKNLHSLTEVSSHTIHHGYIIQDQDIVDEVLVSVFKSPRSYTGENSVEIGCHGGFVIARKVLETILDAGARLAEPGEFTRRAFLNGHLDLTQAEAVVDLIHARTERAARAASEQLAGGLSRVFDDIRDELLQSLAHVEAYIDFPDEDIAPNVSEGLRRHLTKAKETIFDALETFREGYILRNGFCVAIVGRPNAGKSSLLNALLKRERAIVSEIPGTTRDAIEAEADIGGVPITFVDTAGVRESENAIEMEGVRRSRQWIERADVILWVVDGSEVFSEEDETFYREIRGETSLIVVVNKQDLPCLWNPENRLGREDVIPVSCLSGEGLPQLKQLLCQTALGCEASYKQGSANINSRHRQGLIRAHSAVEEALKLLYSSEPIELLAGELHIAVNAIGELLGKTTTEDLLDSIFSQFCIGK